MPVNEKKLALALFSLTVIWGCGQMVANLDSRGQNLICFGDSITQGVGATPGQDYPALLSQLIKRPVLNEGHCGDTSRDALDRLKSDVLLQAPYLVIIQFNGNDFLQNVPLEETLNNLDQIVREVQSGGAVAVLAEVRVDLIKDQYEPGMRDIAKRRQAVFIPDLMRGITFNPQMKSDPLHPNDQGYRVMAGRVHKAIAPLLKKLSR